MNRKKITVLFELADRAKDLGEYDISNIIFAYLAKLAIAGRTEIQWTIEADYPDEFPGYYDLFVLYTEDKEEEGFWDNYLNIPVPLVSENSLAQLFEEHDDARFIERGQHERCGEDAEDGEIESMWVELKNLLTDDEIGRAEECLKNNEHDNGGELYGVPYADRRKEYGGFIFFAAELPGYQYYLYDEDVVVVVSWRNGGQTLPRGAIEICRDNDEPRIDELPEVVIEAFRDVKRGMSRTTWKGYHPTIGLNLSTNFTPMRDDRGVLVGTEASLIRINR